MTFWRRRRTPDKEDLQDTSVPAESWDDDEDGEEFALSELASAPQVARVVEACPAIWRNATYRDDPDVAPAELDMPLETLLDLAWLGTDDGEWRLSVSDEWKPVLDLDAEDDVILTALSAHPLVGTAYHEDRELFIFEAPELDREGAAALALSALLAGHKTAVSTAGLPD
jgi:hypothetical protein